MPGSWWIACLRIWVLEWGARSPRHTCPPQDTCVDWGQPCRALWAVLQVKQGAEEQGRRLPRRRAAHTHRTALTRPSATAARTKSQWERASILASCSRASA